MPTRTAPALNRTVASHSAYTHTHKHTHWIPLTTSPTRITRSIISLCSDGDVTYLCLLSMLAIAFKGVSSSSCMRDTRMLWHRIEDLAWYNDIFFFFVKTLAHAYIFAVLQPLTAAVNSMGGFKLPRNRGESVQITSFSKMLLLLSTEHSSHKVSAEYVWLALKNVNIDYEHMPL